MAPMRVASRETLREAVLRWVMPFCAVRTITGSASLSAARGRGYGDRGRASRELHPKALHPQPLPPWNGRKGPGGLAPSSENDS